MTANREYKDSVFSQLFSDPDTLRELYGAISGTPLPQDIPIVINTLKGVLFKGRMNDISFVAGGVLVVLIEHQSTINENMPLRLLLYIAKIYESLIGEKNIYRGKRITLPLPEFIVLYNGKEFFPEEKVLKLSEAFKDSGVLGRWGRGEVPLELEVKVYNINPGHNEGIIGGCETLGGYSRFIGMIREKEGEGKGREEAIEEAVKECISRNILKDFLERHRREVVDMLYSEWNWDDALAVQREEGREEGLVEGREEGLAEGREEGREEVAKKLQKHGMRAEEVAEYLELPLETVFRYLDNQ